MNWTIRPLKSTDSLSELTALLHRAYARLGQMGLNYTAVDQSEAITAERLGEGHALVAEQAGQLVGTLVVTPPAPHSDCAYFQRAGVASFHQFAVDPALQGQGLGRALIAAAEAWARTQGYTEMALDTAEQAQHLIDLYSRQGYHFVEFVQWPGKSYRSVVMAKVLDCLLE